MGMDTKIARPRRQTIMLGVKLVDMDLCHIDIV